MESVKIKTLSAIGVVTGFFLSILGGWDIALRGLVLFMSIDYITGVMIGGIFHKSPKSPNGGLSSESGLMGLCKKAIILSFVIISHQVDLIIGTDFVRSATIMACISNELISIIENASIMGIKIPKPIVDAIDVISNRE